VAAALLAALEPGRGPRRFLAGGPFLTWPVWTDTLGDVVGRRLSRVPTPRWSLTTLGRTLDLLKKVRSFDYPMTYEAALAMTSGVPTDDSATLDALGVRWRAPEDTFRDAASWLLAVGELEPRHVPALSPLP
jgi:hypothetical protein